MNFDLDKMAASEFKLNEIKFKVTKLSPMAGFKLFEKIRFALVGSADVAKSGNDEESATLFFKAVLSLPPDIIQGFMDILFANIQFTGGSVQTGWSDLKGLEDMAFETLEPVHIYEVFGRSLIVNFTGSFSAIASKFPGGEVFLKQLKQTMSHNS